MAEFAVTISEIYKSTWHVNAIDKESAIKMAVRVRNNSIEGYDKKYYADAEYCVKGKDFAGVLIENDYNFTKSPCQIILKVSDSDRKILIDIPKLINLYKSIYEVGRYEFFNDDNSNELYIRFDT